MDNIDFKFPAWMGTLPRACAPWSNLEDQELDNAWNEGYPAHVIAKKHGRGIGGITSRLCQRFGYTWWDFERENGKRCKRHSVSPQGECRSDLHDVVQKLSDKVDAIEAMFCKPRTGL